MAQLWGGRFTGSINELAWDFNASITFDKRFLEVDVRGSKAHATMLAKQGIISEDEKDQIVNGLDSILADVMCTLWRYESFQEPLSPGTSLMCSVV